MHFVSVDQIELSYNYQEKILRTDKCNSYIDEQLGRFYILKDFEKSETCYINTMAKYLVQDQWIQNKLISFMMKLLQIYRNEGEQGLIRQRDCMNNSEHDYRWIFPNVYFTESTKSLLNEEICLNEESVNITFEMAKQLINEPTPERKPPSRITMEIDDEKNPTCFPAKGNTIESTQISNKKSSSIDSSYISNSNHSNSHVSKESNDSYTTKSKSIYK